MGLSLLLTDSNNIVTAVTNIVVDASGGDMILLGILFIIVIGLFLYANNARSGLVLVIGMSLIFLLSLANPIFISLYWIGLVIGIIMLVIGLKNKSRSR